MSIPIYKFIQKVKWILLIRMGGKRMNSIKQKQKIKKMTIAILILAIFSLSILAIKTQEREIELTGTQGVNNQKIGWGIKRSDNHEQPDVGKKNREVLEQNNGITLGNAEKKQIYLTFDEGYEAGYTPSLLETLKQNNVRATFFITAHYVNTQPELVKQMIDEGHIVR